MYPPIGWLSLSQSQHFWSSSLLSLPDLVFRVQLGPHLDTDERFLQHRHAIALVSCDEPGLIRLSIQFNQALERQIKSINDPVEAEVAQYADIVSGTDLRRCILAQRVRNFQNAVRRSAGNTRLPDVLTIPI